MCANLDVTYLGPTHIRLVAELGSIPLACRIAPITTEYCILHYHINLMLGTSAHILTVGFQLSIGFHPLIKEHIKPKCEFRRCTRVSTAELV